MRTQKLLFVSAAMTAILSAASLSFADDTGSAGRTPPPTTSGSTPAQPGAAGSSTTSSTVMTPSSPSVPVTTTTTPSGTTTTTGATTATTPTSKTTTTAADTETAMSPPTSAATTAPPTGESATIYQKRAPNRALLYTGGGILVGTYATTAAFTAANGPIGDKDLYIPVVGPWINIANRSCSGDCPNETRDTILIAGSGVLQGVGAVMLITSLFVPEKYAAARIQAGPVKMHVTPTAGAGTGGLGAIGTF